MSVNRRSPRGIERTLDLLGSATALGTLWSWGLGNPLPAIGPALLVALAATPGNGGRRVGDDYLPPCNGEPDLKDLAG